MTSQEVEKAPEPGKPQDASKSRAVSLPDLREEMDRLWATLMTNPWRPFRSLDTSKLLPSMDVFEKDGALHVKLELPGIASDDIDISVISDSLTITGEKKEEHETKEANYHHAERTYGTFSRQIGLPPEADTDNITAKFSDGLLEVDVPLKETAASGAKKVSIQKAP